MGDILEKHFLTNRRRGKREITLTDKFDVQVKHTKSHKKRTRVRKRRMKGDGFVFALSGAHGVGKTTIYYALGRKFEDNPNIKLFPERYRAKPPVPFGSKNKQVAFRSEIHYSQQMILRNKDVKRFIANHRQHIAILDRTYLSTVVYSRALGLPKIDLDLIEDTLNSIEWAKEYIIYLEAQPKTIMKRIFKRGSLDQSRLEWNEEDYDYLIKIMKKYNEIFRNNNLEQKGLLFRINTENKTPKQVVEEILEVVRKKSGILVEKPTPIPKEQAKLTNFL